MQIHPTLHLTLTLILCLSLLLTPTTQKLGLVLPPQIPPKTSILKCIAQKNYTNVGIFSVSTSNGIDKAVADNLLMVKNAGLTSELIFTPCRDRNPGEEVRDFLGRIPREFCDRVWLSSLLFADQDRCMWIEKDPVDSCQKFTQFLTEFKKSGLNIGAFTGQGLYSQTFGKCEGLNNYPLYWIPEDPDSQESFAGYRPFGGWTAPVKKLLSTVQVCKVDADRSYQV